MKQLSICSPPPFLSHAFIQFESVEDAKEAMELSLNKEICGRAIGVKFSQKRPEGDQGNSGEYSRKFVGE